MGIAREAALRGLRAAVAERADFAYGTSSRSTRLIHGGLRYLRNFEFRLVRESVVERQRLIRMAPHLVCHRRWPPARLAWQLAQVRHAVQAEMAVRLEDVLRRRTSMMLFSPDNGMAHVAELAQEMAGLLGWSEQRTADEAASCRELVRQMHAWRATADGGPGAIGPGL